MNKNLTTQQRIKLRRWVDVKGPGEFAPDINHDDFQLLIDKVAEEVESDNRKTMLQHIMFSLCVACLKYMSELELGDYGKRTNKQHYRNNARKHSERSQKQSYKASGAKHGKH